MMKLVDYSTGKMKKVRDLNNLGTRPKSCASGMGDWAITLTSCVLRLSLILIVMIFSLTFMGCKLTQKKKNEWWLNPITTKPIIGKKFFEYDSIDYYTINYDNSEIDKCCQSEIDSFKRGILKRNIPNSINDLEFIEKLEQIGYKKTLVDTSKFNRIDNIFVEKLRNNP